MTPEHAVILGIVEGLTEFLPVSSTGHLILVAHMLGIKHTEFVKSFEIAIQLGSIFAVIVLYFERLIKDLETWRRIILAFIPTGILGFLLYKVIKTYLIGNDEVVVISLITGGIALIILDITLGNRTPMHDINTLPYTRAILIGVFQSLAVIPGVSRSGATIIGGILAGLDRKSAAEFAFLLAVPTMLTATAYDLVKSGESFSGENWQVLGIGFMTSFITALAVIKLFINYLKNHKLWVFGVYRIIVAGIYAYFFLL